MRKTMKIQYNPADIPKLKDELDIMMIELRGQAYDKGVQAEQERITKLIEDHGINLDNRPYFLDLIRLIKGE